MSRSSESNMVLRGKIGDCILHGLDEVFPPPAWRFNRQRPGAQTMQKGVVGAGDLLRHPIKLLPTSLSSSDFPGVR